MIDLKELKDSLDVEVVFRLNEPKEYVGVLEDGNNALERIKLVLTQTFDVLGIPPSKQFIISGDGKTILIMHYKEDILGVSFTDKTDIEEVMEFVFKKSKPAKAKKEIEISEEEEAVPEEEEEVTEEVEEVPEEVDKVPQKDKLVTVEKKVIAPVMIEKIEEIAHKYLGDFSLDIVSNVIEESDLDRENPTMDQVLYVTNSLKNAASLIIGPTKATDLEEDIFKIIKEEG